MPSALYSLSDKPNTRWSRRYAEQPEILNIFADSSWPTEWTRSCARGPKSSR